MTAAPRCLRRAVLCGIVLVLFVTRGEAQLPGDANCDGVTDSADLAALAHALFAPSAIRCAGADANADGAVGAADTTALVTRLALGPRVTYLGLVGSDGVPVPPLGDVHGLPVVFRNSGSAFRLVVESRHAPAGAPPGTTVFEGGDPTARPDLQVLSAAPLGAGSSAVCDDAGVPGIDPPTFGPAAAVTAALNDLGCHFTVANAPVVACSVDAFGTPQFVDPTSEVQFCLAVGRSLEFPAGDTVVAAQVRDTNGLLGPVAGLVVRVGSGPPPGTFTPQPTTTATRASTAHASTTPTPRPTPSRTPAPPTVTPTVAGGPVVTFLGLTSQSESLVPSTDSVGGVPVYEQGVGTGFQIVVEGKPGANGLAVGRSAFQPVDCAGSGASGTAAGALQYPDLQVLVDRDLGNGSAAVCDASPPGAGGVPGIVPPSFAPTDAAIAAANDVGCRFLNGSNAPCARPPAESCVLFDTGYAFVDATSTVQFCGLVTQWFAFPPGDTTVTVRLQDGAGNPGPTAQMIVRVGAATGVPTSTATPTPSATRTRPTATPTPTRTPTPTLPPQGPVVTFLGLAEGDDTLVPPAGETAGMAVYQRAVGSGFRLVVEGRPGPNGIPVGEAAYEPSLTDFPDLQIVVSQPLGDGSAAVCDEAAPTAGGVPAVDPPAFDPTPPVIDAVNDFGCRFRDGLGNPGAIDLADDSCVKDPVTEEYGFVGPDTTIQFCSLIERSFSFPSGDTRVTVRLRDRDGHVGVATSIVVRVAASAS